MRRLACLLTGHREIRVREVGLAARPGGILPSIDGFIAYEPHPDGEHVACARCRRMLGGAR